MTEAAINWTETEEGAPETVIEASLKKIQEEDRLYQIPPTDDTTNLVMRPSWYIYEANSLWEGITQWQDTNQGFNAFQYPPFRADKVWQEENIEAINAEPSQQKHIEDLNEDRLELLARKYASSKLHPEEAARLEMITAEMRNLLPSVTDEDVVNMQRISRDIEEFSSFITDVRHSIGLDDD